MIYKINTEIIIGGLVGFFTLLNIGCSNAGENGTNAEENGKELGWMTDYEAVLERAEEEEKPILVNFTGSDWCPPCMMLEEEVFSQPEFSRFAEEEVVLLLIDFPRQKEQSEELQQQNQELAERYGVRGFPTIILLNHEEEVIGQTGYQPGGAENYVNHLQELLQEQE